jgi:hypothetical protein
MADKNTNDFDNEVGGFAINKVPHLISAIIAVGGLVAAYFMTVGEFKVKDMELQQRVMYLEQKVDHIEDSVDSIKNKLDARIPVVDEDRQSLRKEIDGLKEVLQQMRPFLKKSN